jgi:acetolactate synthase-1/2/3 large subunit
MKASDLFVKALENEGVDIIFAVPGEENIDLLESIRKSTINLILTRHEQGAGFMAATHGRLTGKPGVCLATLGPGATNLMTPAAYAQLGAMPMVMITGQKPIKHSKQARFQILDVVNMMRPVTKFTKQIIDGNNIAADVREAFRIAIEEQPGAVHLEFPEDIAREESDPHVMGVVQSAMPQASSDQISRALEMIHKSARPLILIGVDSNRKTACDALRDFVDASGIYFFTTQMGKGIIDERHPLYLGTAALSSGDFLHEAVQQADLIINVGHDIVEKPPFFMKRDGTKVIHVNFSAAAVDQVYFPQLNVVGDITHTVREFTRLIKKQPHWDFSPFKAVKEHVDQRLASYSEDTRFPMLPQRLVRILRDRLDPSDIVALDNGIYKLWFARNYPAYQRNTLLLDNALATMGAGLPSAMEAARLYPDRKVVAVCGDGGFMMNSQELETAVRLGLNLTVIILNDGAYGMIRWKQEDLGYEDYGLSFSNPDFVMYAQSYGAQGNRPTDDASFIRQLEHCLKTDGVHVIELPVDYSLNHPILNELIKQKQE